MDPLAKNAHNLCSGTAETLRQKLSILRLYMAGRHTSRVPQLTTESEQINQIITCPQLHKTKLLKFPRLVTTKHLAMEKGHAATRVQPQRNVLCNGYKPQDCLDCEHSTNLLTLYFAVSTAPDKATHAIDFRYIRKGPYEKDG